MAGPRHPAAQPSDADDVYPDGLEIELALEYNNWVVNNFADVFELARLNDRAGEFPADYVAQLERMFSYLAYAAMPNGITPGLNDSNNMSPAELLKKGVKYFPAREDLLWVATRGKQGKQPETTSLAFPYTGHYVMRSGWDPNARYLLLDAGPFGSAHQHEDKLHLIVYAFGRQLLLDAGNYMYDNSRWRRYVLSTRGHNTVSRGRRRSEPAAAPGNLGPAATVFSRWRMPGSATTASITPWAATRAVMGRKARSA